MALSKKKPHFELVAEKLIDQLEKGTSLFQKPWDNISAGLPYNPTTDKKYRGMNSIWLRMQDFTDPRWMTFKQAKANNWNVNKGEKGSLITYVKTFDHVMVKDDNGNPKLDEKGDVIKQLVALERPIITSAVVFNAQQIAGIPKLDILPDQKWEDIKRVEKIVSNSGVELSHGGNRAFYNPIQDSITMPEKAQFHEASGYYATLLHEMGHWTGHSSRLDRPMVARFGTEDYAKEELRAEIASLMLGGELKLGREFGQHAAYVKSWVAILTDEPFELYRASSDAQKITDYILEFEQKRNIEKKQEASFMLHDTVRYKNENYRISALLPAKRIEVTIESTGQILNLSPKDGLYNSLSRAISENQSLVEASTLTNSNYNAYEHSTERPEGVKR
ncbi:MAG: zincin-like metallopeptidase domain-containing protein [Olivibacter sp.]|nr:zincin-like metallopeptidase domain-containing protein [Olivibacter sp. UJ_SKK_5.1]